MNYFVVLLITSILSAVITYLMLRYRISQYFIDIPNARSMHALPVPRVGGVSVALSYFLGVSLFFSKLDYDLMDAVFIMLPLTIIFVVGVFDDLKNSSKIMRFIAQMSSSFLIVYHFGEVHFFLNFDVVSGLYAANVIFTALFLTWIINLYNFMDGINGIAALELLSVGFCWLLLKNLGGDVDSVSLMLGILCASVLGFVFFNFPDAKCFLGDSGSAFIGVFVGLLIVEQYSLSFNGVIVWMILFGVFIVDSAVTLIRRLISRQNVFTAHRSHAYQRASLFYKNQKRVTLLVVAINLAWLMPLAYFVNFRLMNSYLGLAVAYVPLLVVALKLKAGLPERAI